MEARTLLISGYYGFDNSGDEAVLWSIITALQQQSEQLQIPIRPVVLSADPETTKKRYGVDAIGRMSPAAIFQALRRSDGLISGGGSLLQDVTGWRTIPYYIGIMRMAMMVNKPVFIYAQGIGPVNRPAFARMIRNTFRKCAYISVRDCQSAEYLHSIGIDLDQVEVVPDPVMGVSLEHWNETDESVDFIKPADGQKVVGVSVRRWNDDSSDLDAIAEALIRLAETEYVQFRFLPFHLPSDLQASEYVIERMQMLKEQRGSSFPGNNELNVHVLKSGPHPASLIQQVESCDVLIGMRLHSLIYAANRSVPFVGVSYDPKIDRFLQRFDLTPAFQTQEPDADRLYDELLQVVTAGEAWVDEHRTMIEALYELSKVPAQQICRNLRI